MGVNFFLCFSYPFFISLNKHQEYYMAFSFMVGLILRFLTFSIYFTLKTFLLAFYFKFFKLDRSVQKVPFKYFVLAAKL